MYITRITVTRKTKTVNSISIYFEIEYNFTRNYNQKITLCVELEDS